jgi:hypothetical protein
VDARGVHELHGLHGGHRKPSEAAPNAVFDYLKGFTFANNSDLTTVFVNSGVS